MAKTPSNLETLPDIGDDSPAPRSGRSLMARLAVLLLVVVVVVVECVVAWLCLPSSSETAAMAGVVPKSASAAKKGEEAAKADEGEANPYGEVDLGEFSVTVYQPAASTTLRIDFKLFGSVPTENVKDFQRLFDESKHRFREQVLMTVRSAEMADLTDAHLGIVKRTILEKAKRIIGKPYLREVIVSDYSFIEQ